MRTLLAVALCIFLPAGARGWPVVLGREAPTRLALDSRGSIFAAIPGRLRHTGNKNCAVARFDLSDGHPRWRHQIAGRNGTAEVGDLAITRNGDALFVGELDDAKGEDFVVLRIAAATGRERWRRRLRGRQPDGVYNTGRAAVIDAGGDIAVAGTLQDRPANVSGQPVDYGDFAVARLDGGMGRERWRATLPGPLILDLNAQEADGEVVAADKTGDVIAAGVFFGNHAQQTVTVVKLSGATGQLLWRSDLDFAWTTSAIALDANGDAFLAVSTTEQDGKDFGVAKVSGSSGQVLWVDRESGAEGRYQEAVRVLTDSSGDVFASGMINDGAGSPSTPDGNVFTVVRLDGATGSRLWAYYTAGTAGGGFARELQFGPRGLLIAGGATNEVKTCAAVHIVALDMSTGTLVWSRNFDGTYIQPFGCAGSDDEGGGRGVDNDSLGAMATDARGHVFAGIALTNKTGSGIRNFASIRRLNPH